MTRSRIGYLLLMLLVLAPAFSDVIVINSKDWVDVYYTLLYGHNNGMRVYILNSPNPAGLMNILPKDTIRLFEGEEKWVQNFGNYLQTAGYVVKERKTLKNPAVELMPKGVKNFYVVEGDQPRIAVCTGALARSQGWYVLLVDSNNANSIAGVLQNADKVVEVGYMQRDIENALKSYIDERISEDSKATLSAELARRFIESKKVDQALITDGRYLEAELLKGHAPVLIVGSNSLPAQVSDFLTQNGIKTVVAVGPEMTYVGEKIREISNKKIAVFIKFGMSTPGINPQIYGLNVFPLPVSKIQLEVNRVIYSPETRKLGVEFSNKGDVGVFEFTTFRVLKDGEEISSGGDSEPVFIGKGETVLLTYDLALSDLTGNISVEFYTSYGEDPENMNNYLTQGGKFAPPFTAKLEIQAIEDSSSLELAGLRYYTDLGAFAVVVKNTGSTGAFAVAKLSEVRVQGVKKYLSSDVYYVPAGKEKEIFIRQKMDKIDREENGAVKVEVDFGQSRELLVKKLVSDTEVDYRMSNRIIYVAGGAVAVGGLLFVLKSLKRNKPERKVRRRRRR